MYQKLADLCKKAKFTPNDYVELAKRMKGFFNPDAWLKYFENLTSYDENADLGYFYVLCDLEMIAQVEQKLSNTQKEEFLNIKAFIDLRKQGKNYPLELFFA